MRAAIIVLGTVALAVAGGTGLMLSRYMDKAAQQAEQAAANSPKVKTVGVLVAADALTVGKAIDPAALAWQDWPEAAANAASEHGLILVREETGTAREEAVKGLEGAIVRASMVKGEPVTEEKVARLDKASVLSAVLAPGMRSVTVQVDPLTGAGGMIQPGDRVDLLLTTDLTDATAGQIDPATGQQKPRFVTETFLRDMKVISTDRNLAPNPAPDAPMPANVTIEATPRQAEQVATAQRMGKISLAMRPLRAGPDRTDGGLAITTDLQVMRSLRAAREGVDPAKVKDSANPFQVEQKPSEAITIYRWTQPTTVQIQKPGQPGQGAEHAPNILQAPGKVLDHVAGQTSNAVQPNGAAPKN